MDGDNVQSTNSCDNPLGFNYARPITAWTVIERRWNNYICNLG